jgi:DNA-binding GntR family transcriptional regulator
LNRSEDIGEDPPLPVFPEPADGAKVARVQGMIREMILTGEIAPGHPIRERALADRLGVSRTPMREALKLLAGENLVELHPYRGATVSKLTRQETFEVVQVLAGLEGLAAELATDAMSDAEIAELRALQYELLAFRERRDRLGYFRANQKFHFAIVHGARNAILAEHHRALNARVYRLRFLAHQAQQRWDSAVQEHAEILRQFEARNAQTASQLLRQHVFGIWTRLSDAMTEDGRIELAEGG